MDLTQFIESNIGKSYIWGTNDCFMLICKYLNAGHNHYGKYKTLKGALSYYKKHASELDEYIKSQGYYKVGVNFANDGDLVKINGIPFDSWGIFYKRKMLIANETKGVQLENIKNNSYYSIFRKH